MKEYDEIFYYGWCRFSWYQSHAVSAGEDHRVVSYDFAEEYAYPERESPHVEVVQGDIRDLDAMRKAMAGCDVVVHTAAALPLYTKEDIRSTDIEGSRSVLLAAKANGIERVIPISSTAVYGIPDHHPLLETDLLNGVGPYDIAKIEAERTCAEFRNEGMIVPILRPKSFVGPERLGVFFLLYDWAEDGRNFPMIGRGNNRYQLLDVYDLCSAIYLSATLDKDRVNDTFNVGAEEFTTMREDYQAVLDEAGFGKRIIGFPKTPIIWTLRTLECLHLSPLYKWVYETASEDSFVSIERAKRQLRWQPVYSNKDALLRNYAWYIAHQDEFRGKKGVSHRVPWKQGILGVVKKLF